MEQVVRAKGPNSIKVTWCTGHAREEHLSPGTSNPYLKAGNDIADTLANLGVEHVGGIGSLASFYATKQRTSLQLTKRIHDMFIRVLREEHTLRIAIESSNQQLKQLVHGNDYNKVTKPSTYDCPHWSRGQPAQVEQLDGDTVTSGMHHNVLDIHNFIRTTCWKPVTEGLNGSSWIELMARFLSMGGTLCQTRPDDPMDEKALTLKQQLEILTLHFKRIVNSHMHPGDMQLFSPA